jgi:hypothetical protein
MKIANIQVTQTRYKAVLSADIVMTYGKVQRAYFSVDKKYKSFLTKDASPFLAALLIPAMKLGDDIVIDGQVSSRLLRHTKHVMNLLVDTWKQDFHKIKIYTDGEIQDTTKPTITASFFSAGVDSFYTYLKQKKKRNKITHFILVHGFDIDLRNNALFQETLKNIKTIADIEGVEVIPVETNIRELVEPHLLWDWGHGGALAAVGLMLRKRVKTLFISGALRFDQLFPYGTHPDLDPLWGTETLSFIHDGNEYDRLDKVMQSIVHSPLALKYLRVCGQNRKGVYNCSRCFKCLWTMMVLICANKLHAAKTFQTPIDLYAVSRMRYNFKLNYHLAALRILEVLEKEKREPQLQKAIRISLAKSQRISIPYKVVQYAISLDREKNKRRIYRYIFSLNKNNDRKFVFKMLSYGGIIK